MLRFRCNLRTVLLTSILLMGCAWFPKAMADLNEGLVAYYPFDGNAIDQSGNGHDGTVYGATLTPDRFGKANSAYRFDGVNSYIKINDSPRFNLSTFTIMAWAKWEGDKPDDAYAIVSNYSGRVAASDDLQHYGLRMASLDQGGEFFYDDGSDWDDVRGDTSALDDGKWHFIVGVLNEGVEAKIYIDGQLENVDTTSIPNHLFPSSDLYIGRDGTAEAEKRWHGLIDDVRIYNRALSESEIQQLYSGEAGDKEPFEEGDTAAISFNTIKPLYNVGERIVIDLVEKLDVNRFNRVDLWVVIEMPNEALLFMTELAFAPFSPKPQAFRASLDNTQTTHRILEFEVLPGLGGDYIFYAAYVEEGKNPITDSFLVLRSNLAKVKVVLSNK
jgi:hypothetical protein